MHLDEIERRAGDILTQEADGHQILLDAAAQIPDDARLAYPEIIFQTAKVYINQGRHAQARTQLGVCLQAWGAQPEKQARVYLLHALLCNLEHDTAGLLQYITQVQALSQDDILLAECEIMLGEAVLNDDPGEALKRYDEARRRFLRASVSNPNATADVVRASLRAALVAFQKNMRSMGWQYQRYAEEATRQLGTTDLLVSTLMQSAEEWEREGQYERAFSVYEEALQYAQGNPQRLLGLDYRRARLAIFTNDDTAALEYLSREADGDYTFALAQRSLYQGWWAALHHQLKDAQFRLEEVEALTRNEPKLTYQAHVLRGLIAAQSGQGDEYTLRALYQAVEYFTQQRMLIEASQAKLILAWLSVLADAAFSVASLIHNLEEDIQIVGHVKHLGRLYEASLPLLGGWWQPETMIVLEDAIAAYSSDGVRVYGFGYPRIYAKGGKLNQPIGTKLLLYMVEKRRAALWEIIDAIWDGGHPEAARKRFNNLMTHVRNSIGRQDWIAYSASEQLYVVQDGFPDYYDVAEFKATFAHLRKSDDPRQALAHSLKLIRLYDTFAKSVRSEAFDDIRRQFEAQFDEVLLKIEANLTEFADQLPEPIQRQLADAVEANPFE